VLKGWVHEQVVRKGKKMKPPKLSGRIAVVTTKEASNGSYHKHSRTLKHRNHQRMGTTGQPERNGAADQAVSAVVRGLDVGSVVES
jgi:hypothetical protein